MIVRLIDKLLSLPLVAAVPLIQWVAIFLTSFSAILFDLLAGIIFMITLAGLMFGVCTGMEALKMLTVSFAIFIIPQIAEWLIDRLFTNQRQLTHLKCIYFLHFVCYTNIGLDWRWSMDSDGIMECIDLMCDTLPQLRNALKLTQEDFSKIIGISRQSVINMEHKEKKLTRSIIISMVSFFSLRKETAEILFQCGLYNNTFVKNIGFSESVILKIHEWSK